MGPGTAGQDKAATKHGPPPKLNQVPVQLGMGTGVSPCHCALLYLANLNSLLFYLDSLSIHSAYKMQSDGYSSSYLFIPLFNNFKQL